MGSGECQNIGRLHIPGEKMVIVQPLQPEEGLAPQPDEECFLNDHARASLHEESDVPIRSILHRDGDQTRSLVIDRVILDDSVGRFVRDVYKTLVNRRHDMGLTLITCPLE